MTIETDKKLTQKYLDDTLSAEQRADFEKRLQQEPKLQAILKRLKDRAQFEEWMKSELKQIPLPTEEEQEATFQEMEAAGMLHTYAAQLKDKITDRHTPKRGEDHPSTSMLPLWKPLMGIAAALAILLTVWQLWPSQAIVAPTEVAELEVAAALGTEGGEKAKVIVARYAQHPDYTFHYQWKGTLQDTLHLYGVTPPVKFLELRYEQESDLLGYVVRIAQDNYPLLPTSSPLPLKPM